jgi:hypothetical protein
MTKVRILAAAMSLFSSIAAIAAEDTVWTETLERISSGVVSIRIDSTRAFDTEWNSSSQATGFVVDAERGIILTNRHVVTPGPVIAEAIFRNNEEVRLIPIYRDPVHDFGFFRYDPAALQYIEPAELPLVPDGAGIGSSSRFWRGLSHGWIVRHPVTVAASTTILIPFTTRPHPAHRAVRRVHPLST